MSRLSNRTLILCSACLIGLLAASVWLTVRGVAQPNIQVMLGNAESEANPEVLGAVRFNAHIRPILSDKCFSCHGFDSTTREENLRLDTPEGAYSALESDAAKHAIVPGDAQQSVVWQRITTTDEDDIMPPPDFHKPLDAEEINLITRWIEQGAAYEEHWDFAVIEKPEEPSVDAGNPIDAFVRKNLEATDLSPAPRAKKTTLLRRLSLDLTGLPPSPEELEAFLADKSADAYEKQVARLLASPHYGERMAVPWLDAVRYADTVGYHGDQNARVFPYRDYVIEAFNDNKPFDAFTREQLAGDLLPDAGYEQKIATGFLRLNLMTREGGAQDKEYLAKSAADRVRAIGGAWLGLTTGCAECHDHKFDPFTQRDFYSMAAFFNDVRQWGIYTTYGYSPNKDLPGFTNNSPFPPEIFAPSRSMRERLERARNQSVAALTEGKEAPTGDAYSQWLSQTKAFISESPTGWLPLTPTQVVSSKNTAAKIAEDKSVLFTGPPAKQDTLTLSFEIPAGTPIRSLLLEALPDPANQGQVGRSGDGKFTMTPVFSFNGNPLPIAYQQADRRHPQSYRHGFQSPLLENQWQSAPAIWEEPSDAASLPHHAVYHLKSTFTADSKSQLVLNIDSEDIGKVRVSISPFTDPVAGDPKAMRPQLASALSSDETQNPELSVAPVAMA